MAADSLSLAPTAETPNQPFYPPKQRPLMTRLVQSISYPLARILYKMRISVSEESVGKVRAIDNARIVFVCNHPTMEDGITLFVLSARLGQLFHYIVAYEAFAGLMGWFIQRLGCYSIRRGLGDRASISQTLSLLKAPRCRLVIFPEGGCSYQNDTIMPFRPGAIQLPMSVLSQLAKKAESPEKIPDVYVVPISLKYRYMQPMERVIENTISHLEDALNIPTQAGSQSTGSQSNSNYQRLRKIAHQVILRIETEANLPHEGTLDWNQRIDRLRQIFVRKCESALNIQPNVNDPLRERVYRVQALLEDLETTGDLTVQVNATQEARMGEANTISPQDVYWNTVRLLNFDAIYDGYVAEAPTPERFLDTLMRLEREVFHLEQARPKAPRKACFYIGDPINLKDYLADYKTDRSQTVDRLAGHLHQTMQANLDKMAE
ncbi:MAG: 1-acyl-sn-glycerol-3-phosphate acyltransferase [Cyanobacteria bacterium J06554_3]